MARRPPCGVGRLRRIGQALGKEGSLWPTPYGAQGKIVSIDAKTFTIELADRFGPVLDALGSHRPAFMMPARIASIDADQKITEIVGSGSFNFAKDEWQPGEQIVYLRNPDYVPREEIPTGSTGGKSVHVDK